MKMQFEADGTMNVLWGEDDNKKIVAEIEVIPGASEDYGYITMVDALERTFPNMEFEFPYDGQEQYLAGDAECDGMVAIDMIEK